LVPGNLVGHWQKYGASAKGLQRMLGIGSYETAWTWLHKLRRAMVRQGRDRLSGNIEVDEIFVVVKNMTASGDVALAVRP